MAKGVFGLLVASLMLPCAVELASSTPALAGASLDALCVLPDHKVKRYYARCARDGGQRATFEDTKPAEAVASAPNVMAKSQALPTKTSMTTAAAPVTTPNPLDSKACIDGWNTHLAIGDSFSDLNFLNTANCNGAQAKGAQFSWSRDRVALNDQWSAKGAVAEELIWIRPGAPPDGAYLNMWAIAPTVNFQRVTNSNTAMAAQNANVLSYGFSSEALFDQVGDVWQVYARGRANVNSDFTGLTHSYSTTAEFQALSDYYGIGRNFAVGSLGYFWVIPLVRAQYFERESKLVKDPIFSAHNEVLRVGPVVSLNFVPQDTTNIDPSKPAPTPKWLLNVTYSWYQDFLSSHTFQHVNPSLSYNFTDNIGLTLGYESGQIETTGKKVDLTTISLTVKN
jgi:hypothetical protein